MHSRSSQTPPSGMPLLSRGLACHLWPRSSAARLTYYARTTSLSTVKDHEHPANPQTAGPQERTRRTTCCPAQRVPDSCGSRHPRMEHRPLRNLRRTQRRQPAAPAAAPVSGVPVAGRAGRLVALGVLGVADVGVAQHALGALDAVAVVHLDLGGARDAQERVACAGSRREWARLECVRARWTWRSRLSVVRRQEPGEDRQHGPSSLPAQLCLPERPEAPQPQG